MVFVHHSAMDGCMTRAACEEEMRKIQDLHMDVNGKWEEGEGRERV
jgi:hypothetical protein